MIHVLSFIQLLEKLHDDDVILDLSQAKKKEKNVQITQTSASTEEDELHSLLENVMTFHEKAKNNHRTDYSGSSQLSSD